jgi:hypothetical protein
MGEGLYERAALRARFLAFARSLAAAPGVRFLPLESIGRFRGGDFADLVHTGPRGSRILARATARELRSEAILCAGAPRPEE